MRIAIIDVTPESICEDCDRTGETIYLTQRENKPAMGLCLKCLLRHLKFESRAAAKQKAEPDSNSGTVLHSWSTGSSHSRTKHPAGFEADDGAGNKS
jgi:hypothetical protein